MTFGQKLKKLRTDKGFYTQETLAEAANTSQNGIAGFESGRHLPSLKVLFRIQKTLDVSFDDLLKGVDIDDDSRKNPKL